MPDIVHCGHCGHRLHPPVPEDSPQYFCANCRRNHSCKEEAETIRTCLCGQGIPMRLQFCWYCGAPRDVRPTLSRNFNLLVGISHVLSVIAAPPGRRDRPVPGDLSGTYDFWFEGGAAIHHTGPTRQYDFANGTRAWESTKFGFGIHIRFPDGTEITVQRRFDPPGEDLVLD